MTISYFIPRYFKFHNQKQKTLNFLKLLMCKNIEYRIQYKKKTVLLKIKKKVCILLIFLIVTITIFRSITK